MATSWIDSASVVVTGASGGIGAGITTSLLKEHNCKVIGVARSEEKMKAFVEELGEYQEKFSYKLFDVSVKENWETFYNELEEEGVKVDVLINNAGILPKFKKFGKYSYDEIDRAMNINFYSAIYGVKTFLPMILESDRGAIVNIDSSAALMTLAGTSMYSASKAALKAFTEALQLEYRDKIFVGLICPGFTKTDILKDQTEGNAEEQKLMNLISTNCERMVNMIIKGIIHKKSITVAGIDSKSMYYVNRVTPGMGSKLFSAVMKMAKIDIFKEVFVD